ncbi:unnamed protein product, partial [Didymodactylos carnosus]
MSHHRTPLDIVRRQNSRWNPKKVQTNNQHPALYPVFAEPQHTHGINGESDLAGSGQAFPTISPYQTVHYIIYTE